MNQGELKVCASAIQTPGAGKQGASSALLSVQRSQHGMVLTAGPSVLLKVVLSLSFPLPCRARMQARFRWITAMTAVETTNCFLHEAPLSVPQSVLLVLTLKLLLSSQFSMLSASAAQLGTGPYMVPCVPRVRFPVGQSPRCSGLGSGILPISGLC